MTKINNKHQNKHHHPVLLESVIELLKPQKGQSYLDMTAGYGGHAAEIIELIGSTGTASLIDRDVFAVQELEKKFAGSRNVEIIHSDYEKAASDLVGRGKQYDMVLADLGVSSPHLDMPERGFSFKSNGPLDMRMDQQQTTTAADLIKTLTEEELADVFKRYGEEPQNKRIARELKLLENLETTDDLVRFLTEEFGEYKARSVMPKVFQALRIAVNDELGQLERTLGLLPSLIKKDGRIAIISFHSLEDRLVKRAFKNASLGLEPELTLLTKKPIKGKQFDSHPRARSAMLRVAVK
jgi:16S rRNA (cytosine1402-N4)-methyltransferase